VPGVLIRALLAAVLAMTLVGCAANHEGNASENGTGGGTDQGAGQPDAGATRCAPAVDPLSVACRINAGEATVRDPAASPEALAEAGRLTQDAYRTIGDHPEWDAQALAAVQPSLRDQASHALAAYRELVTLAGPPQPTLPAWRIVDPLPTETLRGLYDEAQRRFGVHWTVLAAVNLVETRMGRIVGLSGAGAQGPMQFMPATWARYGLGGDVWNPRDAILGAANYLAANGGASDVGLDRALRRYNNDIRYVRAVRHYAAMMDADPRAFVGLHAWPVEYRTTAGDIPLPTGYVSPRPIPVEQWLAEQPPR
jgi:hypothetical protein